MTWRGIPPIKSVMTPFPFTIEASAPVAEAWKMMTEHEVRHLPVAEEGRLLGVISDRDVGLAMNARLGTPSGRGVLVGEICEEHTFEVDLETPVDLVAEELVSRHIGSALVMKGDKLAGIFTASDACRFLVEVLRLHHLPPTGDHVA